MADVHRHALIIEDEMLTGLEMQAILGGIGFDSFAFASTARQALLEARLHRPDLVTADIALLDGDGVEACRALEAECGALPIIFVTGQSGRAPNLPGTVVVAKPFGAGEIARAYRALSGEADPPTP